MITLFLFIQLSIKHWSGRVINQKYKYILEKKIEQAINPGILLHINTFSVYIKRFPNVTE